MLPEVAAAAPGSQGGRSHGSYEGGRVLAGFPFFGAFCVLGPTAALSAGERAIKAMEDGGIDTDAISTLEEDYSETMPNPSNNNLYAIDELERAFEALQLQNNAGWREGLTEDELDRLHTLRMARARPAKCFRFVELAAEGAGVGLRESLQDAHTHHNAAGGTLDWDVDTVMRCAGI